MKNILFLILLLLCAACIYAEDVACIPAEGYLNMDFSYNVKQNNLDVGYNYLSDGQQEMRLMAGNDYNLIVMKNNTETFNISFNVHSTVFTSKGERALDNSLFITSIPYLEDEQITLTYKGIVIFNKSTNDFVCNNDNKCDTFENNNLCSNDCPSGGKDGLCDMKVDDICDPDCSSEDDVDCTCGNGVCDGLELRYPKYCQKDCEGINATDYLSLYAFDDSDVSYTDEKDGFNRNMLIFIVIALITIVIIVCLVFYSLKNKRH
jgi:hypothetical protein